MRLKFWLLAPVLPAVLLPLLAVAAPVRQSDSFRRQAALFVAGRWTALPVGPWRLGPALAGLVVAGGVALYLRDVVPALRQGWRVHTRGADGDPRGAEVARRVAAGAARLGMAPPEVRLVPDEEAAYLYCRGFLSPLILVSTGALAKLGVPSGDDGMFLPGGLRFDVLKGRLLRLSERGAVPGPAAPEGLMLALAGGAVALLVFFVVA